eukprot:764936-Hanusia_phi.AAC.5
MVIMMQGHRARVWFCLRASEKLILRSRACNRDPWPRSGALRQPSIRHGGRRCGWESGEEAEA